MLDEKEEETVWRTYPGIDFLQANQFGEIRVIDRYVTYKNGVKHFYKGHVLKQCADRGGYLQVYPRVNGKQVNLLVHRIVATCFLPNPDNLPEINHKDNDPKNNSVSNLEWCTHEYNVAYREKCGKSAAEALGRPVFAVNLETSEVSFFKTQSEASYKLGVDSRNINSVLKGRLKTAGGYWFTENKNEITKEKIQEIKDGMVFLGGVVAVNLKTLEVSRFKSQRGAARQLEVNLGCIQKVLKGRRKQTGGYWFCRADSNAVEKVRAKFGDEMACEVKKLLSEEL